MTFAWPYAGSAQAVSGPYVSLGAGANFLQDERATRMYLGGAEATQFEGRLETDMGLAAIASFGWRFDDGIRVEIEGDFRSNALSRYPGVATLGGTEQKYGGFVNVLYDLDLGGVITPYAGIGAGEQTVQVRNGSLASPGTFIRLQHEDPGWAVQAILGAAWQTPLPGLALTAEYRFMAIPGMHEIYGQWFAPGVDAPAEAHFGDDLNHTLMIGVRYAFNAAPPPPPAAETTPPPAREATRTYLVFFDWDSAALSARARAVVEEAARAASRVQVTRIEVDGYADTSGRAQYNQALSERRAQVVADTLTQDGVPREAIAIEGLGATRLLVATGPGVREPRNRRVEIILR